MKEEICRRLNDPAGLSASLGNQALILMAQGELDEAMRLLKEQEEICRRLNDPAGLSASLGNQALILIAQGELDGGDAAAEGTGRDLPAAEQLGRAGYFTGQSGSSSCFSRETGLTPCPWLARHWRWLKVTVMLCWQDKFAK